MTTKDTHLKHWAEAEALVDQAVARARDHQP
jgi:hypothetical protein